MGLLTVGKPLSFEETQKLSKYVRDHGISQFLSVWNRVKDIRDDELKFGDEIEVGVFVLDNEAKTVKMSIRSAELRSILTHREAENIHQWEGADWHPEFGAWMIESTPSRPYSNYVNDLLRVERNMILRRRRLLAALDENEIAPTVTCFFLLGVGDSIHNPSPFSSPHSLSIYVPDYVINPHPRFAALTENIRHRREEKVNIRVPLYHDKDTPEFLPPSGRSANPFPAGFTIESDESIHMDCMAFGMGMCCLQVTFQARDVDESRFMYDQLAVMAPIMLAITAATPVFKGRLADVDVRWNVISQAVDDRTPAERGLLPDEMLESARRPDSVGDGIRRLYKPRYSSISTYIYHCNGDPNCRRTFEIYNDIPCPVDEEMKSRLRSEGIDENLAHHLAHLFTRDPLVIFEGMVELDDSQRTEHFENIQSTNWNTCRWKPPPPRNSPDDPHIGWRTEFRSMEVQLTDFENAAFTVFIVLLTRVVLAFDLSLYMPLSKVDENMDRAHERDAARARKFFFRKHLAPPEDLVYPTDSAEDSKNWCNEDDISTSYEEMTMNEIFNGKDTYFPGLIPLIYAYLDYINCDTETFHRINQYLVFISKRATGELVTPATWIREQILTHPSYRQDSVVTHEIAHDVYVACSKIGDGSLPCPQILGDIVIDRVRKEDAYGTVLAGRLTVAQRSKLLERLVNRANVPRQAMLPRGQQASLRNASKKAG